MYVKFRIKSYVSCELCKVKCNSDFSLEAVHVFLRWDISYAISVSLSPKVRVNIIALIKSSRPVLENEVRNEDHKIVHYIEVLKGYYILGSHYSLSSFLTP